MGIPKANVKTMESFSKISLLIVLAFVKTSVSKDNNTLSILVNGVKTTGSFSVIEHADIKVECFSAVNVGKLSLMVDAEQLMINAKHGNLSDGSYVYAEKKNVLRTNKKLLCSSLEESYLKTSIYLNVIYPANCSINEINGKNWDRYLSCDCEANPSVKFFWFAANDKIIYNSTGKRISLDRIYPGATNITCSANSGIHGDESPAVLIIPSYQESRRKVKVIVGVVLSAFYVFMLTIIALRYRNRRKRGYVKSSTVEL